MDTARIADLLHEIRINLRTNKETKSIQPFSPGMSLIRAG